MENTNFGATLHEVISHLLNIITTINCYLCELLVPRQQTWVNLNRYS